jgi:hypothetical protein
MDAPTGLSHIAARRLAANGVEPVERNNSDASIGSV